MFRLVHKYVSRILGTYHNGCLLLWQMPIISSWEEEFQSGEDRNP